MSVKYVAQLSHVRELTLHGSADLAYWSRRLSEVGLTPAARDGRAHLAISTCDSKFMGIRFREMVVAVVARPEYGESSQPVYYFVQGFNSNRFFAFVERMRFSTPYVHGQIDMEVEHAPRARLAVGGCACADLVPAFDEHPRRSAPSRRERHLWEGAIYLPRSRPGERAKVFYARIAGETAVYPFSAAHDRASFPAADGCPWLRDLVDSDFAGAEWHIRSDAEHARSKTYRRR